jgi:hypothetical protein
VTARGSIAFMLASAALCATAAASYVSATIIASEEDASMVWAGVPLVLCATAWLALHRRCNTGSRAATVLAHVVVGLMVVFWFITGFSIGLFFTPAVGLLLAALLLTPSAR